LEVNPDHLTAGGEELHVGTEHLDRPEAAVQEDERLALTEDLVAQLDPVDPGNVGIARWHPDGETNRHAGKKRGQDVLSGVPVILTR